MTKKLRGITMLALAVVMICMMALSAFAATSWNYSEDFGSTNIEATANILRRSSTGAIISSKTGDNLSVSAELKYYPPGGGNLITETKTANSSGISAQVTLNESNAAINYMYNAKYYFYATIFDMTGTYSYSSNPVVVTY